MDRWLYTLLKSALVVASPQIIEGLRTAIEGMAAKARATANPFDDALVGFLQMIVGKPEVPK